MKEHLTGIRKNSCYKALRLIVDLATIFSFVGVVVFVFALSDFLSAQGVEGGMMLISLPITALVVILIVAARQSAQLLIDIADTLLHDHSGRRED